MPDSEINQIVPPDAIAEAIAKARAERASGRVSIADPGELSKEVIGAIQRHVDPDKVGRVLAKMLDAKRTLKNGDELDDSRTQEAALKLYLAYSVGTPVQRTESVNVNVDADSAQGLEERLRNAPALRQVFRKLIDKIDGPVVDV
jgi:hypothetical protein